MRIFLITIITLIIIVGCLNSKRNDMPYLTDKKEVKSTIIALEREALKHWNKGNPDYYLKLYSSDMPYFDPFLKRSLLDMNKWKTIIIA